VQLSPKIKKSTKKINFFRSTFNVDFLKAHIKIKEIRQIFKIFGQVLFDLQELEEGV
jgi:hypothetical protein